MHCSTEMSYLSILLSLLVMAYNCGSRRVSVAMPTHDVTGACPRPDVGRCWCKWTRVTCEGLATVPLDIPLNTTLLTFNEGSITYIPETFLLKLQTLRALVIDTNPVTNAFKLPRNIISITFMSTTFTASALQEILQNLPSLKTLSVSNNEVKHLLPGMFSTLPNLRELTLQALEFDEIANGTFDGLDRILSLKLTNNKLRHVRREVFSGITKKSSFPVKIDLHSNLITQFDEGVFLGMPGINSLELNDNELKTVPDLRGLSSNIEDLFLSNNHINDISSLSKYGISHITNLRLGNNNISTITEETFQNISIFFVDLSYNRISHLPEGFLRTSTALTELLLPFNQISSLHPNCFQGLQNLQGLYLFNNNLTHLPDGVFSGLPLKSLFLHGNRFRTLDGRPFRHMIQHQAYIYLFANEITHIDASVLEDLGNQTTVAIGCKSLDDLPQETRVITTPRVVCAPHHIGWITNLFFIVAQALVRSGFRCQFYSKTSNADCALCNPGSYSAPCFEGSKECPCDECPAGGFYQDDMGQTLCKECNTGTFVHPKNTPATLPLSCQACPQGTRSDERALYRACRCLNNFYRLDRFGKCSPCPHKSLKCENDYALLTTGYYWKWWNITFRNQYDLFIRNLKIKDPSFQGGVLKFDGVLPTAYLCPRDSCLGGLDSTCREGYQGPLCAICKPKYFDRMNKCIRCPPVWQASLEILGVIVLFIIILIAVVRLDRKPLANDNKRTVADIILSCFKIVVGFYQVIAGMYSTFSDIKWPTSVIWMHKLLRYIELNVLEIAPLSCLSQLLVFDAIQQFVLVISGNLGVVTVLLLYLGIRIKIIRNRASPHMMDDEIAASKKSCIRNICVFLFATYPTTCSKIIQIIPPNCVELCFGSHQETCASYLRSDYSVLCKTSRYQAYWPVACAFLLYPVGFPVVILLLVWWYIRRPQLQDERNHGNRQGRNYAFQHARPAPAERNHAKFGLSLFYENYKDKRWYWETLEIIRKLILTSGLALIGEHSRTVVGIGAILSAIFAVLYVWLRPIKNHFENFLQTMALMMIFLNLSIGVMLNSPDAEVSPDVNQHNDEMGVSVLMIIINIAVVGIVVAFCVYKIVIRRLVRWCKRKTPCSFSCCCTEFFQSVNQIQQPAHDLLVNEDVDGSRALEGVC